MQQHMARRAPGAAPLQGARFEPVAGLQHARPRESALAYSWQTGRARAPQGASDGGEPQRARPASGAPMSRGQQEARGARQRVALCFGSRGGRVRQVPFSWSRARACQCILELCEWFCLVASPRKRTGVSLPPRHRFFKSQPLRLVLYFLARPYPRCSKSNS